MHRVFWRVILLAFVAVNSTYCAAAAAAERSSPWGGGFDLRLSPRLTLDHPMPVAIHPTVGYQRILSGGGSNMLHLGGQARHVLEAGQGGRNGLWVGGEAAYVRWSGANGTQFSGLVGMPMYEGPRATGHLYGAAGINRFGGHTGLVLRFGIEFQPLPKP